MIICCVVGGRGEMTSLKVSKSRYGEPFSYKLSDWLDMILIIPWVSRVLLHFIGQKVGDILPTAFFLVNGA